MGDPCKGASQFRVLVRLRESLFIGPPSIGACFQDSQISGKPEPHILKLFYFVFLGHFGGQGSLLFWATWLSSYSYTLRDLEPPVEIIISAPY